TEPPRYTWELTYNVEDFSNFTRFSNFDSNPRSFGHRFDSLIKDLIGRIKRRLKED
ncbi:hypothetical protein PIB30_111688, partial [Stylosanthes scabra]|nr:hypothetical protein [Stylosanthes scabra]